MGWTPGHRNTSVLLRSLLTLALAAAVAGCPDSKCEDTPEGCPPPPEDPTKYLVVTHSDAYYTRNGIERRPRDFNAVPVELVADGTGTPVSHPATVLEPGKVRFEVPPGTYLLKHSNTQYILTSSREVNLGLRRFGRPERGGNLVETPGPHPANINVSGLEPAPADRFGTGLYLHSLDIEESGSFYLPSYPNPGQTSAVEPNAEYYSAWGSIPRFTPAQGDTAWVLQQMNREAGTPANAPRPWTYSTIVRAAALTPFAFDGGTMSIQATLQPVPQQPVHFDLRLDEFNAQRVASTAGAPRTLTVLDIYPALKHPQDGWVDFSIGSLLSFSPPSNIEQTPLVRDFSYGNPYSSPWEPVAQFLQSYSFDVMNHDGSRTVRVSESFSTYEALSSLSSAPMRPRLSLARDVKVDGVSAQTARILGTATPVVSWEPPALGTVTAYAVRVDVYRAEPRSLQPGARIYTGPDVRSVRLPPGVLTSGNEYVVRIGAYFAPGVPPERIGFTFAIPYGSATTSSSLLTMP